MAVRPRAIWRRSTLAWIAWIGCVAFGASPALSQNPQTVAAGVVVFPTAGGPTFDSNAGWVATDDYLLLIDPGPGEAGRTAMEAAVGSANSPARFVVHTVGAPPGAPPGAPVGTPGNVSEGATRLVAAGGDPISTAAVMRVPPGTTLESAGRRVELHPVGDRAGGALAIYVKDSGTLFAGDLIGLGRGANPLSLDAWIRALRRLERLGPTIVVPGRGPIAGPEALVATRTALESLKRDISRAMTSGTSREQVLSDVRPDNLSVLPEGAVARVYDELVGLLPATAFVEELGLREGPSPVASSPGWTRPTKVVLADFWPGRTDQLALVAPGVEVVVASTPEEAAELGRDADAILGWLTPEIFNGSPNLRWVQLNAAGVENYVTIPGFAESDIVLSNSQRIFGLGGAEHVLGMVLALSRRLHTALVLQQEHRWDIAPLTGPTPYIGAGSELLELKGRTMLVVGLGGIGTETARVADGIGMRVIATRGSSRSGPSFVEYVGLSSELLDLVPEADVIVNAVPLTSVTEGMFDDAFFAATKPTAIFVNIGRGRTVDTSALMRALREGRIAGAGLDVTEPEPLPADHELWDMPNVLITPHLGGDGDGHMERMWLLFRENLRRFVNGEPLLSVVDKRRGY
jgi:phosphoglycerate dehydrogenase-like enzyme/glyoxylase-like metal-dependent hydrolase (beta-lactamase superfamily II)